MERRNFLKFSLLVAIPGGLACLLTSCKSSEKKKAADEMPATQSAKSDTTGQTSQTPTVADCDETAGLTPQQITARKNLKYTDHTPTPGQTCEQCAFWEAPAKPGECGTCQILPGKFQPGGWCMQWTAAG